MEKILEDSFKQKLLSKNILVSVEKMPNTEIRYKVKIDKNVIYSITQSGEIPSWQNSHFHKNCNEVYYVQKGKMLIVSKKNKKIYKNILNVGEKINISENDETSRKIIYLLKPLIILEFKKLTRKKVSVDVS